MSRQVVSRLCGSAMLCLSSLWIAPATFASPITYEIQGLASGSIGGTAFTNDAFTFIGTANTTGSVHDGEGDSTNALSSLTLNLVGFAPAVVTGASPVFETQLEGPNGTAGFGLASGLFEVRGTGLATYNGVSNQAPTTVTADSLGNTIPTSDGNVKFTGTSALLFSAYPTPVPLPSTIGFLGSGLVGLFGVPALLRRRRSTVERGNETRVQAGTTGRFGVAALA